MQHAHPPILVKVHVYTYAHAHPHTHRHTHHTDNYKLFIYLFLFLFFTSFLFRLPTKAMYDELTNQLFHKYPKLAHSQPNLPLGSMKVSL